MTQSSCNRCGTCCKNGGPALHRDDIRLVTDGLIPLSSLIVIRRGELVHHPVADRLIATPHELVKVRGAGRSWTCLYYDGERTGCTIYDTRPQACRLLKCWDTGDIERLIDQGGVGRLDLIAPDNPVRSAIVEHEELFPCPDLELLIETGGTDDPLPFEEAANREIAYRTAEVRRHELTLHEELFYFGRPLFQLLSSVGATIRESGGTLRIRWPGLGD